MNKAEKSLRWVVNQIPDFKPTTNEEKMLVAIKLYSEAGAEEIKRLESENAELTSKYRQLELTLFTVVRNFKVLPVGLSLGKTKKEITDMTFATIEKIKQSIDYNAVEKLLQGEEE